MRLGLFMQTAQSPRYPADEYFEKAYKIDCNLFGEEFSYVVAPNTLISENSNEKLGFLDEGRIYVNKNLPVGVVPFVGLYYHLMNMSSEELSEKLGSDVDMSEYTPEQKSNVIMSNLMTMASGSVRADDMLDWYQTVIDEPYADEDFLNQSLPAISRMFLNGSIDEIVEHENSRFEHNDKERRKYLNAYSKHKFNRMSEQASKLISSNSNLEWLLGGYVSHADSALQNIIGRDEYKDNLLEITNYVQSLSEVAKGTEIEVTDFDENKLLWAFVENINSNRQPFLYVSEDKDNQSNVIRFTGYGKTFFQSLHKKLSNHLIEEQKAYQQLIENVSTQLSDADDSFKLSEEQLKQIKSWVSGANFAIALSPDHERKVVELGSARDILLKYNVPVTDVEEQIRSTRGRVTFPRVARIANGN